MSPFVRSPCLVLGCVVSFAALAAPRRAEATTPPPAVEAALGPSAATSTWAGDRSLSTSYLLGVRFADLIAIDALTRLGYANVDDRVLTYLSLGATVYGRLGPVRPYLRLAAVHQHEEPRAAISDDPGGALFGVGNGIRHRGGGLASVGANWVFTKGKSSEAFAGLDFNSTYFPDSRGPHVYMGGGLWFGASLNL